MNIKHTCPFGHRCEKAVDDHTIERCTFYINLRGNHPQTGETIDERGCAIGWLPILLIESAQVARGNQAAIESFRNEMVKGQTEFNNLLRGAAQKRLQS